HQIARVSDHRQCPGGREERGRGAQANRLWPDRCRACGGVSEVFHGLLEPVSELPSSVRLCHYRDQLAGEAQANLPPQGLSNALRETHHLKGMDRIPEGGNYGWDAETSVRSSQRHRGCAADAKSKAQLIGALPDNTMRQKRYGNAGAVESVESQKQVSHFPTSPFSGSRRIGIELPFQAHGVLESILDFRLICGLEYAMDPGPHHRVP